MKIEKISESQIKFVLNKTDLTEKNIKITELAYGSEKTQDLFREMMEQAYAECGFEAENTPLMIEAIPVSVDSIMIIVTKVSGSEDIETKFNLLPRAKDQSRFKKKSMLDNQETKPDKTNIYVYSFKSIDDAINLSVRLAGTYSGDSGESSMYKYNNEYFLVFDNHSNVDNRHDFEAVLSEYGKKHISGVISKYHLIEHGETIINESAVQVLASI
ncbi:adaptor protein MecA [Tyzzerella sp. OttesenSCG-928-J15]|nr:adaptor protein MecA [Tyzzerella sp. OttesenSCG-928-J15]